MIRYINVAVLVLFLQAVSMAGPTAQELLDKFSKTADKTHTSFITKSKSKVYSDNKYSGKWAYGTSKRTQYVLEEIWTDGERAKQIRQMWGDYLSDGKILSRPESEKGYWSNIYNGSRRYQYNRAHDSLGRVIIYPEGPEKGYTVGRLLSYKDAVSGCFGYLEGDIERFDRILKKAKAGQVSVRDKMVDLNGTAHYVIDAKTRNGQYTIWLNPEKGYNFSKAVVTREPGDLYRGEAYKLETGHIYRFLIENTQFIEVDGVWVPVKAKTRLRNTIPGGSVKINKDIELTSIVINPDHDALDSFSLDEIKDGARVRFVDGPPGQYIWRDGKVVDEKGRVVFEVSRDSAPPPKAESQPDTETAKDVAMGSVRVPEGVSALSAEGVNGLLSVPVKDGQVKLPLGKYRLNHWEIQRKDKSGVLWKLSAAGPSKAITFEAGKKDQAPLEFGEPLLDDGAYSKRGSTYRFSNPVLKGRHGERVTVTRDGRRPPAPKLLIRNADGSYNRRFSFAYG